MNRGDVNTPYPTGENVAVPTPSSNFSGVNGTANVPPGFLGFFGSGAFRVFSTSGTFTVPVGITKIRVRVAGGGGSSKSTGTGASGSGGGGYAHGVFDVVPGQTFTVTVAAQATNGADGGTCSFGSLISATGGQGANAVTTARTGGTGSGGDFQANGGSTSGISGGAGAGSQLGDGGSPPTGAQSGAAVGGGVTIANSGGASPFENPTTTNGGADCALGVANSGAVKQDGAVNPLNMVVRFPFDGFTGGGGNSIAGTAAGGAGGPGAGGGGGGSSSGAGGQGGYGGGGGQARSATGPGDGGRAAGGGGVPNTITAISNGGLGLVVVEF